LDPFYFGLFGDFIPKERMWDQSKLSGSKVGRGKLRVNIGREDQKRGKFDLGEFG
jgi:hypothetical protein